MMSLRKSGISLSSLHDDAAAGLLAAAAATGLATFDGLRLDDGGNGRSGAGRHVE